MNRGGAFNESREGIISTTISYVTSYQSKLFVFFVHTTHTPENFCFSHRIEFAKIFCLIKKTKSFENKMTNPNTILKQQIQSCTQGNPKDFIEK